MPFDTSVLDEALAQRCRQNELLHQALLARVLQLLDEVGPGYGIQQAYLFGSLVRPGRFHANEEST